MGDCSQDVVQQQVAYHLQTPARIEETVESEWVRVELLAWEHPERNIPSPVCCLGLAQVDHLSRVVTLLPWVVICLH